MDKIKTDDTLLQLQHYEEPPAAAIDKQPNWIPALAGITDYFVLRQSGFEPNTKARCH